MGSGTPEPNRAAKPKSGVGRVALLAVVAVLVCGVPYWSLPKGSFNLPDALPAASGWIVGIGALLGGVLAGNALRAFFVFAAVLPAVAFVRVVLDVVVDPTSHNLWPFELVIAGGVGLLPATIGAALAAVALRLLPGRSQP
jgi:hypothetical protein